MTFHHVPVLRREVVEILAPEAGQVLVDCTLGGGGHAQALLEAGECRLIGLDRDPAAIAASRARCAGFGDRFTAVQAPFSELRAVLDHLGVARVHGLLADLGVSSHQLDTAERGFSFQRQGPIDMRMDPTRGVSAAHLVNEWPESELAEVIAKWGEERRARRVAAHIVAARPLYDTRALAEVVARAVGAPRGRIHPATRTFQALRIATNAELQELEELLQAALERLHDGGKLAVITFHSLEDRIVKRFLAEAAGKRRPRDPYGNPLGEVSVRLLDDRTPAANDPNPRARSARLRAAVRVR